MINLDLLAVVNECLKNDAFVNEYCRLSGVRRPDKFSPIERMINESTGYDADKEFFDGFIKFVDEFVYQLLPKEVIF